MSQFSQSSSAMDSAISEDADRGFLSINQRLQLNQLQEGEVRESLNGRMEGYWKPRKGVVSKTASLTTGSVPLQLPFLLVGTADNTEYLLIESGDTLVTEGSQTISTEYEAVISTSKAIASSSLNNNVVTITITAGHGFAVDTVGYGLIAGLSFTGVDPNGLRLLSYASETTMTFVVTASTTAVSGAGTLSQAPIDDAASANVRASCLFSDPNTNNKEYVIIALDTVAKKIDLETLDVTDIPYPNGQTLNADTDMIQVFDKVMLFRDGQQALEWYPNGRPVLSASQSGTTVTMNVREHGLIAGTSITIAGLTHATLVPANGVFTVLAVSTQDQFTYTFTTSQTVASFGVASATATDGFTLSPGGDYTQPQVFNSSGTQVDALNGEVSLDVAGNVTIAAGDIIVVYETTIPEFTVLVGKEFQVSSATTTNIKFFAPVANLTGVGSTGQIEFGGRFSVGGGFMHQPGAPWGIHFQRRLWVPFYYDQSGAYNNVTYTSRKITDEISVSDILDTTTFDQIENQFRVSGGTADYVVGMHGFYDDGLVVLNRNSLHLVKGTLGSLLDVTVKELTSEIGCLARKSVVMRGNAMLFLSDDGVYGVEFLNDYNLRGTEEPLSKNIQPYIDRINKNYAADAVGMLFDNRYYLAVALDSIPGAGDAIGNNSVLVYNFKNQGWESLDTYGNSQFLIKNFIIGGAGVRNDLYAVSANGGLHQIDAEDSSLDRLNVSNVGGSLITAPIYSSLTTRGYDLKTMERKRFTDAQILMQNLPGDTGEYLISFAAEDPDNASEIGTTTQFLGGIVLAPSSPNEAETASIRCRLGGIRGYTGTMVLTRTIGSPKINSVKVAGSVTNRQIISQK